GDKADDHVEGGRLAGAVRPEQADHFAAADLEGNVVHDAAFLVPLVQVAGAERAPCARWLIRHVHSSSCSLPSPRSTRRTTSPENPLLIRWRACLARSSASAGSVPNFRRQIACARASSLPAAASTVATV